MKKNMVYFVLYIVILVELLIVITERDDLEAIEHEIRDKMITSLAKSYKQPLILAIPNKETTFDIKKKEPHNVALIPVGLVNDEEKKNVTYYIDVDGTRKPPKWPAGGISSINGTDTYAVDLSSGNAVFRMDTKSTGNYKFVAYCEVERVLPEYLPHHLMEMLIAEVGEYTHAVSDQVKFQVRVTRAKGLGEEEISGGF